MSPLHRSAVVERPGQRAVSITRPLVSHPPLVQKYLPTATPHMPCKQSSRINATRPDDHPAASCHFFRLLGSSLLYALFAKYALPTLRLAGSTLNLTWTRTSCSRHSSLACDTLRRDIHIHHTFSQQHPWRTNDLVGWFLSVGLTSQAGGSSTAIAALLFT